MNDRRLIEFIDCSTDWIIICIKSKEDLKNEILSVIVWEFSGKFWKKAITWYKYPNNFDRFCGMKG